MTIREDMQLLAKHEGQWRGVYTTVDPQGNIIDKHDSHLTCEFPEDGEYPYHQVNRYTWPDGRTEEHVFPATFNDKKIWFDTDRIKGAAWEVDDKTIYLEWQRKGGEDLSLCEMIQLSKDGNKRSRTWHWFQGDKLVQRTLIEEHRVS